MIIAWGRSPDQPIRCAGLVRPSRRSAPRDMGALERRIPDASATPGVSDQEYGGELAGSAVTMASCSLGEFVRAVIMKEG